MGYGAYTSRYLDRDLTARPKAWHAPLLYEHLLSHLRCAQLQIRRRDADGLGESLEQASAVVADLVASVDQEGGGELARHLASVYAYFGAELVVIRRTLDQEQLAKMVDVVASLHESSVIVSRTQWPVEGPAGRAADSLRDARSRP